MTTNGKITWDAYLVTEADPFTPLFMMEVTEDTAYHARRAWFNLFKEKYPLPRGAQLVQVLKYIRLKSKEPRKEYTRKEEVD